MRALLGEKLKDAPMVDNSVSIGVPICVSCGHARALHYQDVDHNARCCWLLPYLIFDSNGNNHISHMTCRCTNFQIPEHDTSRPWPTINR